MVEALAHSLLDRVQSKAEVLPLRSLTLPPWATPDTNGRRSHAPEPTIWAYALCAAIVDGFEAASRHAELHEMRDALRPANPMALPSAGATKTERCSQPRRAALTGRTEPKATDPAPSSESHAPAFGRILCGVDGSPAGDEAVHQAAALLAPEGALTLIALTSADTVPRHQP